MIHDNSNGLLFKTPHATETPDKKGDGGVMSNDEFIGKAERGTRPESRNYEGVECSPSMRMKQL